MKPTTLLRYFRPSKLLIALIFAIPVLSGTTSQALVTPSVSGADEDERALQADALKAFGTRVPFPFFKNIGFLSNSTAVYIGNGYVLTAAHVGSGVFRLSDGSSYLPVTGSEQQIYNRSGSKADLLLFRIAFGPLDSIAQLQEIPFGPIPPPAGSQVLVLSAGRGAEKPSYAWDDRSVVRWGLNRVEQVYTDWIETFEFRTAGFSTGFEAGSGDCQAAPGDSGGAAFVFNQKAGIWQLGGIILAVDSEEPTAADGDSTYIGTLMNLPKEILEQGKLVATR
ncbi:MAG: hypothetical protein ACI8UO_000048 [Verrucomicrobiales bacterium]|jgi:hypothetical protein